MGQGAETLRAAYGASLAAPLPPTHALIVAGASLCVALALVMVLFAALDLMARRAEQRAAAARGARPTPAPEPEPSPPDLAGAELLRMLLGRLARLAALADDPTVQADAERLRLVRAAMLSTYRDCEALGAVGEARALLHLPL